jgi:uncharacterized protein (UPF0262 family)
MSDKTQARLIDIIVDDSIGKVILNGAHDRAVAIYDLLQDNRFRPVGDDQNGPYRLKLSLVNSKLVCTILREDLRVVASHTLSLSPLRRTIKDYFMVCDSYDAAIFISTPSQIEAIDMGRRSLHNEGSEMLKERLAGKIEVDFETARRLFTLICLLHSRG